MLSKSKTVALFSTIALVATFELTACGGTSQPASSSSTSPQSDNGAVVASNASNGNANSNENVNANVNSNTAAVTLTVREKADTLNLTEGYSGQSEDGTKTYYCAVDNSSSTRGAILAIKDDRNGTLQYYIGKCMPLNDRGENTVKLTDTGTGNSVEFQIIVTAPNIAQITTTSATASMSAYPIDEILNVIDPPVTR